MAEFYRKKKKICQMCAGKDVDYKNVDVVKKYVSNDKGKILPRRMTGACAKHQRHIAGEVKKARFMALLPFVMCFLVHNIYDIKNIQKFTICAFFNLKMLK